MGALGAGSCFSFEWKKWIGCLTANIVGGVDQLHCLFVYVFLSLMCHSLKCTNMEDSGKYSIYLESCLLSDPQYHSIVPSGRSRCNSFSTFIWSLQTSNCLPIHTICIWIPDDDLVLDKFLLQWSDTNHFHCLRG